jgi:hypothetical protein
VGVFDCSLQGLTPRAPGYQVKLSMAPRDEVGDDVNLRLEWHEGLQMDWAHLFAPDVVLASIRLITARTEGNGEDTKFVTSGRVDDFHNAGTSQAAQVDDFNSRAQGVLLSDYVTNPERELAVTKAGRGAASGASKKKAQGGGIKDALPCTMVMDSLVQQQGYPRLNVRPEDMVRAVAIIMFKDDDSALPPVSMYAATKPNSAVVVVPLSPSPPPTSTTIALTTTVTTPHVKPPSSKLVGGSAKTMSFDHQSNIHGKTLGQIRAELVDEEKRAKLLEAKVHRLEQNVEELMQELELVSNMPQGPEKQAANEELARAEVQLVETRRSFADCVEKIAMLERELDRIEALDELRSRGHGIRGRSRGGGDAASNATAYGALAGAAGMLIAVIAVQWLMSSRTRRAQHHQAAFVPVRYVNHSSFGLVGKRL